MGSTSSLLTGLSDPRSPDVFLQLPKDIQCLIIKQIYKSEDYQTILNSYPKLETMLRKCIVTLYGINETLLFLDQFLAYENLTSSDFIIRIDNYEQLAILASKQYLTPRIVLSNDFIQRHAGDKLSAIIFASLNFIFLYFQHNKFVTTSLDNYDQSTSIIIVAEEDLSPSMSMLEVAYFKPSFYISGGYSGSILYNNAFTNRLITTLGVPNGPQFSVLLDKISLPVDLYDLYLTIFRYLGIPLNNLILGAISKLSFRIEGNYVKRILTNNKELKSISMATPVGLIGDMFTSIVLAHMIERIPYIKQIGLNMLQYNQTAMRVVVSLETTIEDLPTPLLNINKIVLIYSEKNYPYALLISKFPNLREIEFVMIVLKDDIHADYLLQFVRNNITVYLRSNDDTINTKCQEINQRLYYPFHVSDTITASGLKVPHQLIQIQKRIPNIYLGTDIHDDDILAIATPDDYPDD
jgi:hypothetical protein